jgi:predicted GNAT family acetyltransferase
MTSTAAERSAYDVRDNPERNRYELLVGEQLIGTLDYYRRDDVMLLPHTVIDPGERGNGWGDVLVRTVLEDFRRQGLHVVPQCWFVAEFVGRNPEYRDLLS